MKAIVHLINLSFTDELLVKLSKVYNVTTDYILRLTDKKN